MGRPRRSRETDENLESRIECVCSSLFSAVAQDLALESMSICTVIPPVGRWWNDMQPCGKGA
jgi:hypothetical protein